MLYGDRLRLRAVEKEDLPRFAAWLNDPEVREYLLMSLPLSTADEEHWYEMNQNRPAAEHALVIEIQNGAEWQPVGNVSLMDVNWVCRSAEIGLFIGEKSCWNKGYGREVMQVMLKHAFESLNLNRVYLRVMEHNLRGIKSYEHAGFQHEGRMRQAVFQGGRYYDILLMSVLREEWNRSG